MGTFSNCARDVAYRLFQVFMLRRKMLVEQGIRKQQLRHTNVLFHGTPRVFTVFRALRVARNPTRRWLPHFRKRPSGPGAQSV